MSVPGAAASHSIITEGCRSNRGDVGAFEEAVERARKAYDEIVAGWRSAPLQPTVHLVLTVERPIPDEASQ